jgi:hypothetical protein
MGLYQHHHGAKTGHCGGQRGNPYNDEIRIVAAESVSAGGLLKDLGFPSCGLLHLPAIPPRELFHSSGA